GEGAGEFSFGHETVFLVGCKSQDKEWVHGGPVEGLRGGRCRVFY
ncbi:uncharacterized protein METZ01_LOCUS446212, partial [marine metagenome]